MSLSFTSVILPVSVTLNCFDFFNAFSTDHAPEQVYSRLQWTLKEEYLAVAFIMEIPEQLTITTTISFPEEQL